MTEIRLSADNRRFVDRQIANIRMFRDNLDSESRRYLDSQVHLVDVRRRKPGPSAKRARLQATRDRMTLDLKRTRYTEMTAGNFAERLSKKISEYRNRFDPSLPQPADEEKALLHFIWQHFGGKWSAKSVANLLAKKPSQSRCTP